MRKPIKRGFDQIKEAFRDNQELLKKVINDFYLQLSCNEKSQASISSIKNKILEDYTNDDEKEKIEGLIKELDELKDCRDYLKEEDYNIILLFKYFIKKI